LFNISSKFKSLNTIEYFAISKTPLSLPECKFINQKQNKITVAYDNNEKKMESVYSKRIRAGKRRTYFFDVRETRGSDYYLTITESRKRFDSEGYDRHKIFLYKEDFNKFIRGLIEAVEYVKTDLMPDFDFDAFNHDTPYESEETQTNGEQVFVQPAIVDAPLEEQVAEAPAVTVSNVEEDTKPLDNGSDVEVDKW
jgi:hypothetical protein